MLNRPLRRIESPIPVQNWRTYQVSSPVSTHYRDASCREIECANYMRGWTTTLDVSTIAGRKAADFIRMKSGRSFTHTQTGNIVVFTFSGGQRCFTKHKVPVGRPEIYVVRGGDHRGNPTGMVRRHTRPEHFVEEMAEHLDKLHSNRG